MCEKAGNEGYLQNNTMLRKEATAMTLTELFPFEQAEVPFPSLLFISHCKYNDFFSQITLFSSAVRNKEKICCHCSVQSFRWLSLTLAKRKQVFQIKNIAIIFCLFFIALGRLACKCCHPACWCLIRSTLQKQGPFTGAT